MPEQDEGQALRGTGRVAALVLAAGRGARFGAAEPKAFLTLAGRPIVVHAIEALAACDAIGAIVPVLPPAELGRAGAWRLGDAARRKLQAAVAGGAERQDSVRAGLAALPAEVEIVAVHDAARALVRPSDVGRAIAAAERSGAALLAVPVRDTLKRVRGERVVATEPREGLWAAQTPQVFRAALLREALAKADADGFRATDDAQLVERLGVAVEIVPGDPANLKLTWPPDLAWAEAALRARADEA
jgi:2-C-methyl-D-erythritol 4-phosphate cytidylyltransferase